MTHRPVGSRGRLAGPARLAAGIATGLLAALLATPAPARQAAPPAQPPPAAVPPESVPPTSRAQAQFRMLVQRGLHAMEIEDYISAVDVFEQAVRIDPANVAARYQLARAWAGRKQVKPAGEHYREVLRLQPGHAGALIGLAAVDEATGDWAAAETKYREVIAAAPNPRATRALAMLLARTNRTEEAETLLQGLLRADPHDVDSRYELGLSRELRGDCPGAIPEFRAALADEPDRAVALLHLGNCLNRTGKQAEAAPILERFRTVSERIRVRLDNDKRIYFLILEANGLATSGRGAEAVAKAAEAAAVDPNHATAQAFYGSVLAEAGRMDEAQRVLTRAVELAPGDAISMVEIGRILAVRGRFAEAEPWFKRAAAADSNLPDPHRFLAILYEQSGRRAEAEREKALFLSLTGGGRP